MNKYEWLATLTPPELAEWLGKIACPPGEDPFDCCHEGVCQLCWLHYLIDVVEDGDKIMFRTHVAPDWNRGAVSYALRKALKKYYDKTGNYPNTVYASNNFGNFFPFVLCTFAIRNKLVIRFVPNVGNKPFFYFALNTSKEEGI